MLMKVAKEAAQKSSHSDVQQKVKSLITRYKMKSMVPEEGLRRSDQFIPVSSTRPKSSPDCAEQQVRSKSITKEISL
jgi:hypothetical protein